MSAQWVNRLNESASKLHKQDVLEQILSLCTLGSKESQISLSLISACYNPFVTFGVKKVPVTEGIVDAENPWFEFNDLLEKLQKRELTGHAARDAIARMSERFDSEEWNIFCAAVLKKDLRAGISEKSINKICKNSEYKVPVFACQLATSCDDRPEMKNKKRLEPKLDGVRVLMHVQFDPSTKSCKVVSYSRNGKVFDNFTHIEQQISDNVRELMSATKPIATAARSLTDSFFFDGEVVGKSFNELMRQARRKTDSKAADTVYHIFDVIPEADFLRGHWNTQLEFRVKLLQSMKSCIDEKLPNVELLDSIEVDLDVNEGRDQFRRYANDSVAAGFEGIMIKDMGAPYLCKRTTYWMKWKPTITVDLPIIGLEEGTGKNVGRLGAFICEGTDHGKFITVNVGSGFSDEERQEYWDNQADIVGCTAEILCDVISQNQDGTYSLRFPRFVRFRDDK